MEIFTDIEQNTLEWLQVRAGMPTSSCFKLVSAKPGPRGGKSHKEYLGRTKYKHQLGGEIITGRPMENFVGYAMRRGQENEASARKYYALEQDVELTQVGFIKNGNCGASPDALVGQNGMLEIKDAEPHVQIERLLDAQVPPEHKLQVQGQLMVAEREWCDFMSHCRDMPPLIVRVYRDEPVIASLRVDINQFVDELNMLVEWLRRM